MVLFYRFRFRHCHVRTIHKISRRIALPIVEIKVPDFKILIILIVVVLSIETDISHENIFLA